MSSGKVIGKMESELTIYLWLSLEFTPQIKDAKNIDIAHY